MLTHVALTCSLALASPALAQDDPVAAPTTVQTIQHEAEAITPLIESDLARRFLSSAQALPSIPDRVLWWNPEDRIATTDPEFQLRGEDDRAGFEVLELDERYYYLTRHGTPVAFARALDLAAKHGLASLDSAKICDFGFSTIGHLRMMASCGADVQGIEINPITEVLYSFPGDQGPVPSADPDHPDQSGSIQLHYGSFPSDTDIVDRIAHAGPLDVFFSKNTLKYGYIHPQREVDPRMTIDLGVTDREFCQAVFDLLKPNGLFVIYNICPKLSAPDEPYKPWSDGHCPFTRELLEELGFEVLAYNADDTPWLLDMARAIGWDESMDLDDLYAMYTVLRK